MKDANRLCWIENHRWYLLIGIIVLITSIGLCFLLYGIHFLKWFDTFIPNDTAKSLIEYFLLGMLGSSSFSAFFFAQDSNRFFREKSKPPTYLDPLGYTIHVFGGGITGIVLLLLIKAGFIAVNSNPDSSFRDSFALIIAFLGGMQSVRVKKTIFMLGKNMMKVNDEEEKAKNDENKAK